MACTAPPALSRSPGKRASSVPWLSPVATVATDGPVGTSPLPAPMAIITMSGRTPVRLMSMNW